MENARNKILQGSCFDLIPQLEDNSIDLVVTSPPYAEQRKKLYGGIPEKEYPDWTASWMSVLRPKLKPQGSVAIVIRTNVRKGCISDYVLRTRLKLHEEGWEEPEELLWIKSNSPPVGSYYRPRRSWEHILWFTRAGNGNQVYCDTHANGNPSDRIGMESKKLVGDIWVPYQKSASQGVARSRDYVEVGTSSVDRSEYNTHPAQFPVEVAEWLILMLSAEGGLVLDPFVGSGTTCVAANRCGRDFCGMELSPDYCRIAERRVADNKVLDSSLQK